jgi:hypothetical protein
MPAINHPDNADFAPGIETHRGKIKPAHDEPIRQVAGLPAAGLPGIASPKPIHVLRELVQRPGDERLITTSSEGLAIARNVTMISALY